MRSASRSGGGVNGREGVCLIDWWVEWKVDHSSNEIFDRAAARSFDSYDSYDYVDSRVGSTAAYLISNAHASNNVYI
jgi:hypothetical protein